MTQITPLPSETPPPTTPTPAPTPATPPNWCAFSPLGQIAGKLAALIDAATRSVDIAMYEWTNPSIANALVAARKRSITLRTVLDSTEAKAHISQRSILAKNANDVRTCASFYIMHNKYMLIDNRILVTGSYNWSADAESHNAENVICLYDQPQLLARYAENFNSLWSKSQPA